ncbi:helix-turn-helix domain-containing protein [Streptomyces misionensis]|uniref:helix-turn-helix domain-containing protein n=1 Tax=Streptomyces misionensis TaxID=67331 RepID=UPI0016462595|nr:helix-turn-helix domain-containing protein [Streptomyces misionensis]
MRITMTSDDLPLIRMASAPDPIWELLLSVQRLRDGVPASRHGAWRERVRREAAGRGDLLGRVRRVLMPLLPRSGAIPDFLTPDGQAGAGVDDRIEAGAELRSLLRDYHACAIRPYWNEVRSSVDGDRLLRARSFLDGGIHGHLRGYAPFMRWEPPVLRVPGDTDRCVRLEGSGLFLLPSHFCGRTTHLCRRPGAPAVLVYPAARAAASPGAGNGALARVVGTTRAAILVAAETAATAGELGRRAGVSGPTVSHHLSALRGCGLLRSFQHGPVVLHIRTPAGSALVGPAAAVAPTSGG